MLISKSCLEMGANNFKLCQFHTFFKTIGLTVAMVLVFSNYWEYQGNRSCVNSPSKRQKQKNLSNGNCFISKFKSRNIMHATSDIFFRSFARHSQYIIEPSSFPGLAKVCNNSTGQGTLWENMYVDMYIPTQTVVVANGLPVQYVHVSLQK